ncbi:HNH endonuclease signature motif containing protein [[Empedobacter] haloabium]|uniref:HNH endonuclease signature motif containing protein n=1 Tax=[Empedobacter] haloabium TaxID=592317 RepID=A0ABZ1USI7_9BURK
MRLKTLKPRLSAVATARVPVLTQQPGRIERKRGSAGVKDRAAIKARDCGLCRKCGALGSVVDHIVPLWKGGSDEPENKQTLCDPCHQDKTAQEANERARGY